MPAVRFDGVTKRYRLGQARLSLPQQARRWIRGAEDGHESFTALEDVSFDIARGASVALVGANGAGKTTILKLMAGITRPTAGRVHVSGRLTALIELGAGFHGDLTGRENVFLYGALLGLSRAHVRSCFDDIVQFAELDQFIDTPVKRYSSGMLVRLGFAVATSVEPDVLLVDEVLAVGDAAFSLKCLARVEALRRRGVTLVFVSHNPYLVRAACQSAFYLRRGRLVVEGTTEDVLRAYDRDVLHATALGESWSVTPAGASNASSPRVVDVELFADGLPVGPLAVHSQAALEVRLHCQTPATAAPVHVAVDLIRADDLLCTTLRSAEAGGPLRVGPDTSTISVHVNKLRLTSGTYRAEAYLLAANGVVLLTPVGARSAWFTVTGRGLAATNDAGIFEPDVHWTQQDVSQTAGALP
jgi:lipopolysaccharide transport system ATP-binding protein